MSKVIEHPPQPRRHPASQVVIGHDGVLVTDPDRLESRSEYGGLRQWMPTRPRRRSEVGVDVEMDGARQMARVVRGAAVTGSPQVPATIDQPQCRVVERIDDVSHGHERARQPEAHWRSAQRSGVSPIGMSASACASDADPFAGRRRPVM